MKSMAQEGGKDKEMGDFEDIGKVLNGLMEEM